LAQVAEYSFSMHKALGSVTSISKKRKIKRNEKENNHLKKLKLKKKEVKTYNQNT
jgi:hypothetical protein